MLVAVPGPKRWNDKPVDDIEFANEKGRKLPMVFYMGRSKLDKRIRSQGAAFLTEV
jgi:hypothetical protein